MPLVTKHEMDRQRKGGESVIEIGVSIENFGDWFSLISKISLLELVCLQGYVKTTVPRIRKIVVILSSVRQV